MKAFYIDLTEPNEGIPSLTLSSTAFKKIHYWTHRAALHRMECSGLGSIKERVFGDYYVEDVWLIRPETVSQGHVDMDPMAVGDLMVELFQSGKSLSKLKFHWHSHAHFNVFWSSIDDQTSREFCSDAEWTVSLVVNTHGHHLARMDFPNTKEDPIHNLPTRLEIPFYRPFLAKLENDYQTKYVNGISESLINPKKIVRRKQNLTPTRKRSQ